MLGSENAFVPEVSANQREVGAKKGKGGGVFGNSFSSPSIGRRRSLADRITNSTCRICGAAGHWKRECPLRAENRRGDQPGTNEVHFGFLQEDDTVLEVVDELPPDAREWEEATKEVQTKGKQFCFPLNPMFVGDNQQTTQLFKDSSCLQWANSHEVLMSEGMNFNGPKFASNLCHRLQGCGREPQ